MSRSPAETRKRRQEPSEAEPGRPGPKPEREGASRRNIVTTKLADDELAACQRAAECEGMTVSELLRDALLNYHRLEIGRLAKQLGGKRRAR